VHSTYEGDWTGLAQPQVCSLFEGKHNLYQHLIKLVAKQSISTVHVIITLSHLIYKLKENLSPDVTQLALK
jgi:hypothetical protein